MRKTHMKKVTCTYKNHRGETSVRLVRPLHDSETPDCFGGRFVIIFGATQYHPEPQWLMRAFDINKDAERSFAMKDISDWKAL